METRQATSIEEIKDRAGERVVELPGFGDGKPFFARLRRVSLLQMATSGKIPNELKNAVAELYNRGRIGGNNLQATANTMTMIAERALIEPTIQALAKEGLELTDEQLTAIYLYARSGAEGLRPFRQDAGVPLAVPDGPSVEDAAKRVAGA